MEHKAKEVIPEHEKEVITHKTCDICKRSDDRKATKDYCDIDETEISFRDVERSYPGWAEGTTYTYDICHDCFKEILMPALADLGAEPRVDEWD